MPKDEKIAGCNVFRSAKPEMHVGLASCVTIL